MKLKQASARLSFAFQVLLGRLQHNRYNTKIDMFESQLVK